MYARFVVSLNGHLASKKTLMYVSFFLHIQKKLHKNQLRKKTHESYLEEKDIWEPTDCLLERYEEALDPLPHAAAASARAFAMLNGFEPEPWCKARGKGSMDGLIEEEEEFFTALELLFIQEAISDGLCWSMIPFVRQNEQKKNRYYQVLITHMDR